MEWEPKDRNVKIDDSSVKWKGSSDSVKSGVHSSRGSIKISGPQVSQRVFKTGALITSTTLHYGNFARVFCVLAPIYQKRNIVNF